MNLEWLTMTQLNDQLAVVREEIYSLSAGEISHGKRLARTVLSGSLPKTVGNLESRESRLVTELRQRGYDPGVR